MDRRTRCVLAGVGLLAPAAAAQRLELDSSGAEPRPGDGHAALALVELLEREASEGPGIGETGRALRRLAAALLQKGEFAGQAGSEAIVAALTIAAERERIDAQLAGADAALAAYAETVLAGGAPAPEPREVDLLLRDALGVLVEADAPACGWWSGADGDSAARITDGLARLRALVEHRRLRDDASEALVRLLETLELAPARPAYHGAALGWIELIDAAAGAIGDLPDWLGMPARDRLREDLSSGLLLCTDQPDQARVVLGRTASHVRLALAADGLGPEVQTPELREAVERLVSAPEHDALREPEAVARIAGAFDRALALLDAGSSLPPPADLVRQVRPMLEPLASAHARAASALARELPAMLTRPDPMTEPGVVAAMQSLTRSARDLTMPARLSRTLAWWPEGATSPGRAPGEPTPVRAVAPVGEQIRRLGVSLSSPAEAPAALASLREIDGIAEALLEMPGERELRSATPPAAWRLVTGGQESRIAFVIDEARRSWARSHSSDQFAAERQADTRRIAALHAGLTVLQRGVALESLLLDWNRGNAPSINAWSAWEIGAAGADALAEGLRSRLSELASVIARADDQARAQSLADEIRRSHGAALLLGALEIAAQERSPPACSAAAQLAFGPPRPDAWLLGHRHALAQVCRAAYEAGAAAGEGRARFLDHANRCALPVLDALGAPARE